MKFTYLFAVVLLLIVTASECWAQKMTISGTVADAKTGERLLNATILTGRTGTVTNEYGFFSISLSPGKYTITLSYVGYEPLPVDVNLLKDTVFSFRLNPSASLNEVVVTEKRSGLLQGMLPGSYTLTPKQVSRLPVLLGEADVIKAVQLLPGVQACNEASGGLMVRGGGIDGNLILLDDVPVFNVSHLWGLFSLFDPDVLKSVQFYNGDFPSKFGGRTSSVLDLRLKDGNLNEYHGKVAVGVAASKLFIEGPLVKDKCSFLFSARRTYLDLPLSLYQRITHPDYRVYKNGFYFYDIIGKISWNAGQNDRLFLSVYSGADKSYKIEEADTSSKNNATLKWGNFTTALRWNHIWSPRLFSNVTATYTLYRYYADRVGLDSDSLSYKLNRFDYQSFIRDSRVKFDAGYFPSEKLKIELGAFVAREQYNTGKSHVFAQQSRDTSDYSNEHYSTPLWNAIEYGAYLSGNFECFNLVYPSIGIRGVSFVQGEKSYYYAEPRLSVKIASPDFPVDANFSFATMHQAVQLLSNYGISLPIDLWVPATETYAPIRSDQYSLKLNYRINNSYKVSVGGYSKTMDHLIDYQTGKAFSPTDLDWEAKVEEGEGRSKGVELLVEKSSGKLTGWITYTLSKTDRRFENINDGEWYPSTYDHRHEFKVTANYQIKEGIDVNATWIFGTGSPVTLPESKYYMMSGTLIDYSSDPLFIYSRRNSYRMPDYHRLDVGINFSKPLKHGKRVWSVGVYNLYNRKNPYYLTYESDYTPARFKTNSLLPFIPYLTYSYEF